MAGTLSIDTLQDGTGQSIPVLTVIRGSAKAYVSFDGSGNKLMSWNVSSVTRTAMGLYTVNFTTPFDSANYICAGMSQITPPEGRAKLAIQQADQNPRTTTYVKLMAEGNDAARDNAFSSVAVFSN